MNLPNGDVIEYVHDPLGRWIAKIINGTTVEKYLWQGLTRLLAVYDGSNNLIMRFEYADGRMPVAMTRGGATYYLTYDQVGSLRVVADSAGNVATNMVICEFLKSWLSVNDSICEFLKSWLLLYLNLLPQFSLLTRDKWVWQIV